MSFDVIVESFKMLADWQVLLGLIIGCIICQIIVAIPGLGGTFVLAVILPFIVSIENPMVAVAVLIGAAAASGTGNTVTSILFGIPGSSMGIATMIDGYPMAKKGLAGRALAAGFASSAVGGIFGAIVMAILIPFVRPIVLMLGPPEFFMLTLLSVVFIASIVKTDTLRAVTAGFIGVALTFIGQEPSTGGFRYTFESTYLWSGIPLVPFVIGLFAISEMIRLMMRGGNISGSEEKREIPKGQVRDGVLDVFRHWKATMQSSIMGVVIGLIPGLGGETAQFTAYSWVAKTSKNRDQFGKGTVEGVIAADAATNSKEGGAFIPTLLLGIPGSSGMAVLLVILIALGIQPGVAMAQGNLDFVYGIVWMLVLTSVVATLVCLLFTHQMAKLTNLRAAIIIAPVLAVSIFGSYAATRHVGDIIVMIGAGLLGYVMDRFGYSKNTLLIGYVLGSILEQNFLLSHRLFGMEFLTRPITLGLGILLVVALGWPFIGALIAKRRRRVEKISVR